MYTPNLDIISAWKLIVMSKIESKLCVLAAVAYSIKDKYQIKLGNGTISDYYRINYNQIRN